MKKKNNIKDIRIFGAKNFIKNIEKILIVCSSKGGVGKSTLVFILSSLLSQKYKVGVWDIDLTNPSLSIMFNINQKFTEEEGIVPPEIFKNLFFLSITFFGLKNSQNSLALRGESVSNIILELLTITRWPSINYLIIDTPPTITDTILDLIRFLPGSQYIVVSSFSTLSIHSVSRLINFLISNRKDILALVFNQYDKSNNDNQKYNQKYMEFHRILGLDFQNIFCLFMPYIENIEELYGKIQDIQNLEILKNFAKEIYKIL